MQEVNKSG
jgi:hypothetical protein